ncbi:MAG TPA: OmpA family protein [Kofleriaceae bacterium]|nr:OmpA family protein [Kofleriaceae bacterium]
MSSPSTVIRSALALAAGLAGLAGLSAPALAGPDFVADDRAASLAASDARRIHEPADEILFALDDAELDSIGETQLDSLVRWLGARPDDHVVVEGHADSSGGAEYNAALAARRAEGVRAQLVGRGVEPDRILVAVYGENRARARPVAHDRRVTMYASRAPIAHLVSIELDHDALEVVWTRGATRLRETRGITPVATIASRR